MVKTKFTKRSGTRKCPMCSKLFQGDSEFSMHVVQCAMKEHACEFCDFTSQKECNVRRHMKRAHTGLIESPMPLGQKLDTASGGKAENSGKEHNTTLSSESDLENEEWLSQDPGDLLLTESENNTAYVSGQCTSSETVNKPDSDIMVGRVFRKKTSPLLPGKRPSNDDAKQFIDTKKTMIDIGTQTEFCKEISVKTVKKFREGTVDIKEITVEKFI
ncbi:RE1-silencing transcription factor A-like [Saccostrea echinata]|uniref:RE1-silencing transcription factor A-like n=1 Tax=Saccostrea echinata TaxID=191078 RepID=UPI002A7F66E3|nr:RE1-silencing transcription factor A-like [Saccostrea echinata]